MKRKICGFVLIGMIMMSGCTATAPPQGTSQEMYDLGVECLDKLNAYVDGKLSLESFSEEIEDAYLEGQLLLQEEDVEKYSNDEAIVEVLLSISIYNRSSEEGDTYEQELLIEDLEEALGR